MTQSDWGRSLGFWVASVAILCCCCLPVAQGIARANTSDIAEVRLGHGLIGSYHWAVFASREGLSGTPKRPCLTAASGASSETDSAAGFTLCGAVSRNAQILVAKSDGTGMAERTVLGMAFGVQVRSVHLWLRGKKSRRYRLKRLSAKQAAVAGLVRFRYATDAFAGPFCLRRFATYDALGDRLIVSPRMGCPRYRLDRVFSPSATVLTKYRLCASCESFTQKFRDHYVLRQGSS